jgi:hypothetical protein
MIQKPCKLKHIINMMHWREMEETTHVTGVEGVYRIIRCIAARCEVLEVDV